MKEQISKWIKETNFTPVIFLIMWLLLLAWLSEGGITKNLDLFYLPFIYLYIIIRASWWLWIPLLIYGAYKLIRKQLTF